MCFLGCQRLADYLEGVKKNYESTAQVLKHNCETHRHGESCYKLGAYHVTGKGNLALSRSIFSFYCSDPVGIVTFCVAQIGKYGLQ